MGNPARNCPRCGVLHKGRRITCAECIRYARNRGRFEDDEIALTGGRWVNDNGIQRWIGPDSEALVVKRLMTRIARNLAASPPQRTRRPPRPTCGCGCLLVRGDEPCPACRWELLMRREAA